MTTSFQMLSNNCFNINQIFTLWSQFHLPHYVRFFLLKDAFGVIINIPLINFRKIKPLSYVMHFQCTVHTVQLPKWRHFPSHWWAVFCFAQKSFVFAVPRFSVQIQSHNIWHSYESLVLKFFSILLNDCVSAICLKMACSMNFVSKNI